MPPVGVALTTNSSSTNGGSYSTASVTPATGKLILATVLVSVGTGGIVPDMVCAGNGLTWVKVVNNALDNQRAAYTFRAMGTPTAGAVTFSTADGSTGLTAAVWQVVEYGGVDTSGANGAGAVVQAHHARAASGTFPTAVGATSSTYSFLGAMGTAGITAGSGWTSLGGTTVTTPGSSGLGQTAEPGTATIAGTGTVDFFVAVEIKAAASGGTSYTASPADTVTAADQATPVQGMVRAGVDTAGLTDATAAVLDARREVADLAGVTDSVTATLSAGASASDVVGLSDAATVTYNTARGVADTAVLTDAVTASLSLRSLSVADSVTATDNVSATLNVAAPPSRVTVWTGSAWEPRPPMKWDGTAWVPAPLTVY